MASGASGHLHYLSPSTNPVPYLTQFPQRDDEERIEGNGDNYSDESAEDEKDGSKKRKRPMSVSCEICKTRKVKCDRGQPTCGWCLRNGQICEYKERKKPGLRAGYGRELEARLDRLEAVIQTHGMTITQLTNGNFSPPAPPNHNDPNMFAGQQSMHMQGVQHPDITSPVSRASGYTPHAQGNPDYRESFGAYQGGFHQPQDVFPKAPATANMLPPDAHNMYNTSNMAGESSGMGMQGGVAALTQDADFPPYDLLYALADLYFKHINTWCPILHRRSTLDSLFGPASLDEADRILLHAIVATTLRFSTDARLTQDKKERYHSASKQKVLLYGLENSSVRALQALVILALDLCGSSNGPPGWNLLALITRSAVQLGLSVEVNSQVMDPRYPSIYTLRAMILPVASTWIEDESRRRLFWMVYVLDRYATITTAFDFALDEKEIDRRLPCRDDLFSRNQPVETKWFGRKERQERGMDKPENLGSFSYYIEIVGILSQIHQFLKKPVDIGALEDVEKWQAEYRDLNAALESWKHSLPREYGNTARLFDSSNGNKIVNCGWVMLHATYHTTIIRLHSSAAYPTNRSPIFSSSFSAVQRCQTAVESIHALCTHVRNNQMLNKLGPPFAFSVWVATRLLLVHSSTVDQAINPSVHFFVEILRDLGVYWKVADRYAAVLNRVLDEFAESERNPVSGPNGERVQPSCVQILADMRRCAYDLDFLISRQPKLLQGGGMEVMNEARTPAPHELEYLDVFDFFNMPRVPMQMDGTAGNPGQMMTQHQQQQQQQHQQQQHQLQHQQQQHQQHQQQQPQQHMEIPMGNQGNEFNITNFTIDAKSDWL